MTEDQVLAFISAQVAVELATINDHQIGIKEMLVRPEKVQVIARSVQQGKIRDDLLDVWLVAEEKPSGGYRIIMRDDGSEFGLASSGFPSDHHLVLVGWYGDLLTALLCM